MDNDEKKKETTKRRKGLFIGISLATIGGLGALAVWALKDRERLKGENKNLAMVNQGLTKQIARDAYYIGKKTAIIDNLLRKTTR